MNELKLADLGEGMHEAEVVEWLVQVGDTVKLDQVVLKVETDKAIVEIPSPVAGRITELCFQPGQVAKVGEVLAVYDAPRTRAGGKVDKAEPVAVARAAAASSAGEATPAERIRATLAESPSANGADKARGRVLAAPAVRKLAFELGVDLAAVPPSAANGRVTLEDVRAYAERASASPAPHAAPSPAAPAPALQPIPRSAPVVKGSTGDEVRKVLVGLRRQIAERMQLSWRSIPHATAFDEMDAGALIDLRKALLPAAEKRGVRLTYMPLLIKLLIPVLKEFTIFNASFDEEKREIVYKRVYHMGVATATPDGLMVPVLRNADKLSVMEIAEQLEHLVEGANKRTLAPQETHGSTFTLNNVGSFGGSSGTPIINYPEAAILAVGRIEEKAVVREGKIVAVPRMPLAMSFDHRLIDGAQAGAFLARFKELVERPQQLLLDMI